MIEGFLFGAVKGDRVFFPYDKGVLELPSWAAVKSKDENLGYVAKYGFGGLKNEDVKYHPNAKMSDFVS